MKFLKTPTGLIIISLVLLVVIVLITYNWATIRSWFVRPIIVGDVPAVAPRIITTPVIINVRRPRKVCYCGEVSQGTFDIDQPCPPCEE